MHSQVIHTSAIYDFTAHKNFNAPKKLTILLLGGAITFGLFAAMQALIKNDGTAPIDLTTPPVITIAYDFEEKPTNEIVRLPPKPEPKPIPKVIPQIVETTPDDSFQGPTYIAGIPGPKLALKINNGFQSTGGEARPIVRIEPKYPAVAVREGIEGWVRLSFSISPTGTVKDVKVVASEPKRVFDKEAKRALAKWKYKPNIVDGKAQTQQGMMVMLDFTLAS